jgi:hypothetical protein
MRDYREYLIVENGYFGFEKFGYHQKYDQNYCCKSKKRMKRIKSFVYRVFGYNVISSSIG